MPNVPSGSSRNIYIYIKEAIFAINEPLIGTQKNTGASFQVRNILH
jgi:hypothetical protein